MARVLFIGDGTFLLEKIYSEMIYDRQIFTTKKD